MLYQSSDKVKQYLTNYNITSLDCSRNGQNFRFSVENIQTGLKYKIESENPLYNVLSKEDTELYKYHSQTSYNEDTLRRMTFSDDKIKEQYEETYLDTPYYKKFKTLKHDDERWSTESFSYLELKDLVKIKNLTGLIEKEITEVYGHFIKLSDNSVRLILNPKSPIIEDVDEVLMCDYYMMDRNNHVFPMYYLIYTKLNDDNVYLEQANFFTQNISNRGTISVNLTDMFKTVQPNMREDISTLDGYNSKWFIANNIFNFGIFYNTPTGIVRYIPVNLDSNFFNIAYEQGVVEYNVERFNSENKPIIVEYAQNFNAHGLDDGNKNISKTLTDKRLVPWTDMENIDLLNQLLHLSSTAEYFNDVLFSLNDDEFKFPVYLVKSSIPIDIHNTYDNWSTEGVQNWKV